MKSTLASLLCAAVLQGKWRLVGGRELYNIAEDPTQKKNVMEAHPEIVKQMSTYYDNSYKGIEPVLGQRHCIIVGSQKENPIKIYSNEWVGDYCTNPGALKKANAQGYWNLDVFQDDVYEIELRRWPEESGKALTDSHDGKSKAGAVPVAKARLQVGNFDQTVATKPDQVAICFEVNLRAGKTELTGGLLDTNGKVLCGAMYVKITRK